MSANFRGFSNTNLPNLTEIIFHNAVKLSTLIQTSCIAVQRPPDRWMESPVIQRSNYWPATMTSNRISGLIVLTARAISSLWEDLKRIPVSGFFEDIVELLTFPSKVAFLRKTDDTKRSQTLVVSPKRRVKAILQSSRNFNKGCTDKIINYLVDLFKTNFKLFKFNITLSYNRIKINISRKCLNLFK